MVSNFHSSDISPLVWRPKPLSPPPVTIAPSATVFLTPNISEDFEEAQSSSQNANTTRAIRRQLENLNNVNLLQNISKKRFTEKLKELKPAIDAKASSAVNVPKQETVFKDLVSVDFDPQVLVNHANNSCSRKRTAITKRLRPGVNVGSNSEGQLKTPASPQTPRLCLTLKRKLASVHH